MGAQQLSQAIRMARELNTKNLLSSILQAEGAVSTLYRSDFQKDSAPLTIFPQFLALLFTLI